MGPIVGSAPYERGEGFLLFSACAFVKGMIKVQLSSPVNDMAISRFCLKR